MDIPLNPITIVSLNNARPGRYGGNFVLSDGTNMFLPAPFRAMVSISAEDGYYTVAAGDPGRFDLIAWRMYHDCSMWWVIALYNGIADISSALPGTILRIPSLAKIKNVLF